MPLRCRTALRGNRILPRLQNFGHHPMQRPRARSRGEREERSARQGMGSAGLDLLARAAAPLWGVLERWRAETATALNALAPEPGLTGTVLDRRLLQPFRPGSVPSTDPGVKAFTALLERLLPT